MFQKTVRRISQLKEQQNRASIKTRADLGGNMKLRKWGTAGILIFSCGQAFAGGTTAGGGNIQPADQVSENLLISAVVHAKPIIQSWFSSQLKRYKGIQSISKCEDPRNKGFCEIGAKLFDANPNIFEVVNQTEIETKMNEPCLDFNQQPNDGSMFGQKPGSICISISNIKEKLREDNYENQIVALLLHEVSHLLGTTEDEANYLQWEALNMDFKYLPVSAAHVQMYMLDRDTAQMNNLMQTWSTMTAYQTNFRGMCRSTDEVLKRYEDLYAKIDDFHLRYYTPREIGLFKSNHIKMRALWNYICSQDSAEDELTRQSARNLYDWGFKGKSEISAPEYNNNLDNETSSEVMLTKVTSREIFGSEVEGVAKIFDEMTKFYGKLVTSDFKIYSTQQ